MPRRCLRVSPMTSFGASVWVALGEGDVARVSPATGLYYQASISPRGTELVYFGGEDGYPRLWRQTILGSSPRPITPPDSGARHPTFDWLGDRVAFASDRDSPVPGELIGEVRSATIETRPTMRLHIYTCLPDGSNVRQVTDGPFQDHRPAFSPDGKWILFASNRSGHTAIWKVSADGGDDPTPVFVDHWGYRPSVTRDGRSVLFYGPYRDRHRIWKVDTEKGVASVLAADDRGVTHGPFVPPEGGSVLAHSTRGGTWDIWEFSLDEKTPPIIRTPPGFEMAAHASRARDGTMAFDVKRAWRTP